MADARGPAPDARVVEFEIPSDVRFIEDVVEAVRRECTMMRFADQQVTLNVPVALTEALANAILRGNGEDRDKHVHVSARVDSARIVIEVSDEGGGFDLEECTADPTTPERLEREDGRGLFLMRALMDHVERFEVRHGNVVRMTLDRA